HGAAAVPLKSGRAPRPETKENLMEHEIVGQAVDAAVDGALAGAVGKKKEPMTGKKTLKAMEQVMNAIFFVCGMVAVAFVLLISIYLIISGLPAIIEIGPINFLFGTRW